MSAMADTVEINGINYNLVTEDEANKAEVIGRSGKYSGSIVIPETVIYNENVYNVTSIGNSAFYWCSELTSVSIPDNVTSIGSYCFAYCSNLSNVSLSNNLSALGMGAFAGCSKLESITVPGSIGILESSVFQNCTGLKSVVLSEGITEISHIAFNGCTSLISIALPSSLSKIGSAFSGCSSLESIILPKKLTTVNGSAFSGCSGLKELIIEDGESELFFSNPYTTSNIVCFSDCPLENIYIGRNIERDENATLFVDNKTLKTVSFGENVTMINSSEFYGCENLSSLTFSKSINTISSNAFWGCSSLKRIVIPSNVRTIGENAFANTKMSELIIEEGENSLSSSGDCICSGSSIDSVFWGRNGVSIKFKKIKHLVLGNISYFWSIGTSKSPYSDYKGCDTINVLSIKAASDTLHFAVAQTVNFSSYRYNYTLPFHNIHIDSVYCDRIIDVHDSYNTGRTFNPFAGVNSSFKLTIGNSITSISNNMFAGCNIPSVFIPKNIKKISSTSFNNCLTLSGLVIEDSSEPLDFGEGNNFYGCQLGDVYIGRNMRFSTNSPFYRNKEGIQKLTFGNNVTEIPNDAFSGLKNLKELTLPQNLKTIGTMAFYGCEGLTELTIPGSVTEIGQQAFDLCNNLKTLRLDDGKELLKFTAEPNYLNNAFQNSPLEEVYIGRNFSFNNSSPLAIFETMKSLSFGEEVLSIQARSFIGCPNLKDVTSYSKVVPTTNDIVFTPSYQTNATLHVPYALYDSYKTANVWKDFGTIVNFEGLYNLVYNVDGEEYKKYVVEQSTAITPEPAPAKEGYTFSGWSSIPTTMPANDVTVTGSFTINKYKISLYLDNQFYKTVEYDYNSIIALEDAPKKEGYTFDGWKDVPATMPANDISIYGTYTKTTAVYNVIANGDGASAVKILSPEGKELSSPQHGLNIIVYSDGTIKKIMVK